MKKRNYEKLMTQIYKMRAELFKINNPPKYKIGEEVYYIGYGIERKKITDVQIMGLNDPEWFYSFGVAQDWTNERFIRRVKD